MRGRQGHKLRRQSALELLEAQLKSGQKQEKVNGKTTSTMIPHTEKDTKRIKKEIETLQKRIQKGAAVDG